MPTVSFLWHLHQPCYRTADGVAHAPWVVLHAGGSYATLARAILDSEATGQVVNIVPTLLEQMLAYKNGTVTDPLLDALRQPTGSLSEEHVASLLGWAFHVPHRQLTRYPRLRELATRAGDDGNPAAPAPRFGRGDLRDLQVLTILAHAGESAWRDQRLAPLHQRGRNFSSDEHNLAVHWLLDQPAEIVELWRRVGRLAGVEIATSPFAHPIMPLLVDTAVVVDSWAPAPAPEVPDFRHPDDAALQLELALRFMEGHGFKVAGCWPPEGSVSAAALAVYAEAGVRWVVTDEGILAKSLGLDLHRGRGPAEELYRAWRPVSASPTIFFRDRHLSDLIGFTYGGWPSEHEAARAMVAEIESLAATLPRDAAIVVALDGENAWLHYPDGGGEFLRTLFTGLKASTQVTPATLSTVTRARLPRLLPRVHPGSWINAVFATWIGHPEKTLAWRVLARVREAVGASGQPLPEAMVLAEASDWFWWLGDDNPTALAPLYDRIFRHHLSDACRAVGLAPPDELTRPIKTTSRPIRVPVSDQWAEPTLDGRLSSYFEWSLASWIHAEGDHPLRRLAVWGNRSHLFLLIESEPSTAVVAAARRVVVHLQSPEGDITAVPLEPDHEAVAPVRVAVGRVAELALPWRAVPGYRLQVTVDDRQLPEEAAVLLEPFVVDEGVPVDV